MAHFGWTWDYLLWGLPWVTIQKMMIDAPGYDYEDNDKKGRKVTSSQKATKDNTGEVINFFNSIPR